VVFSVIANSFWIVGLALLLAAFSYHYDAAQRQGRALRRQLQQRSFTLAAWLSATLVSIGLAGTSDRLWESAIWLAFTIYGIANFAAAWRSTENDGAESEAGGGESAS
jgi:hypothetical protein